jgi:hypothetical protein
MVFFFWHTEKTYFIFLLCDTTLPRSSERERKSDDKIKNEGEDESEGKEKSEGEGESENDTNATE